MNITLGLVFNQRDALADILRQVAAHLNRAFDARLTAALKRGIASLIRNALQAAPEYGLISGELRGQLGLVAPTLNLERIITAVAATTNVFLRTFRVVNGQLEGGLVIQALNTDFRSVLGLSDASFRSENGHEVAWLEWLLTAGTRPVVLGYTFSARPSPRSRTGLGTMRLQKNGGGGWSVPSALAGTSSDNWLTRALTSLTPAVEQLLEREIRSRL